MSESMEKATNSLMTMCEEMNAFARSSVDANMKSVSAVAKGWEETSQNTTYIMQENLSRLMSVGKMVTEAKSVRDVVSLQQEFMKECMDFWMASASKLSEISARTAKDVVEPVTQHTNEAISRIMQKTRVAA